MALYLLMVDNVDMVDATAFITRICEACRWRRGREPAAISSCHWGRGTTHLCLITWDSKGEGGVDAWWSDLCRDFQRDLQVPVPDSPLGWDRHEICQKNSATATAKNAYFAIFANSRQKCVNGLKWDLTHEKHLFFTKSPNWYRQWMKLQKRTWTWNFVMLSKEK